MALVGHQERKVESHKRLVDGLRASLGPEILLALEDPRVVEIMLDPTEEVFVERLGSKIEKVGTLSASDAESVIGTVAHALGTEVTVDRPIISGELPLGGHRFEGLLPPTVALPTFTIRKKTSLKIQLGRYIQDGTLSQEQADFLRQMMAQPHKTAQLRLLRVISFELKFKSLELFHRVDYTLVYDRIKRYSTRAELCFQYSCSFGLCTQIPPPCVHQSHS